MKILLTALMVSIAFIAGAQWKSNSDIQHHNLVTTNLGAVQGFAEHLPPDYYSNPTKKYPMIVMLHGKGEYGNGSSQLYKAILNGPGWYAERGGKLCKDGQCFIVITPQLTSGSWTVDAQEKFWDYILNRRGLRYDPERIYLTGLSLGANGVYRWTSSNNPLADKIAAIGVVAGWGNTSAAQKIMNRGISVSAYHGSKDEIIGYSTGKAMYDALKNANNPYGSQVKWTPFWGEMHNIWWKTYRLDEQYMSPNMYSWFLSKTLQNGNGGTYNPPPNKAPTVNAGSDKTIDIHTGSAFFKATASDPDGSIVKYRWTKVSGPYCKLWNTDRAEFSVSEVLTEGTYEFKIVVTDDAGATATDYVKLYKDKSGSSGSGGSNNPPTVNAGKDQTLDVHSGSTFLQATASDSDGSIAKYQWIKVSGPYCKLWHPDRAKLGLSDVLTEGTYKFKVIVTDNDGATAEDYVNVYKVKEGSGSSTGNKAPTVNAGADQTLNIHSGSAFFEATASDPDGSVVSYQWTKVSGPYCKMWHPQSAKLGLSDVLTEGTYEFKVTVKDNDGAIATDYVKLYKVKDTGSPKVDAGEDVTLDVHSGSAFLEATASDPDGEIVSYKWTKVSGPYLKMWHPDRALLGLSDVLTEGTYKFKVVVTDNDGNKATDYVNLYKVKTISGMNNSTMEYSISPENGEILQNEVVVRNFRSALDELDLQPGESSNLKVYVMNTMGVMLIEQPTNGRLPISQLNSGMYIYRLATEDGRLVQKGRIIKY